jgi:hypothetical protein
MRGFKDLSSIISELYRHMGLEEEYLLGCLKQRWPLLVGEGIADNSEPFSIKDGELLINVSSHVWAEELKFSTSRLLERLKPFHVRNIKFRIGKIKSGVNRDNNCPTIGNEVTLSEALKEFIDASTSSIPDEELRYSIKRAMEKAFIRRKNIHDPRRNPF